MGQLKIGQIGLGRMGLPIARRLLAQPDFAVTVFDTDSERLAGLDCAQAHDLAGLRGCDVILTCLPSEHAVEDVFFGPSGLLASGVVSAARAAIDTSTVSPELAIRLSQAVAAAGSVHVEAPLIGSPADAGNAALYIPYAWSGAGAGELPAEVDAVLKSISRAQRLVGGPGTAALTKVMQNGLGLVQVSAAAEAIATCRRVGIDPAVFADVVVEGRGMAGRVLIADMARLMVPDNADITAYVAIAAKDAGLYAALLTDRPGPGAASAKVFAEAAETLGAVDYTRIIELFDGAGPGAGAGRTPTHE